MCRIYATQDPEDYTSRTRSIRLNGQSTSIRLERAFWAILDEISVSEGHSTPQLISTLHDEVLKHRGEVTNFTSLLRCTCLKYLGLRQGTTLSDGPVP